jgi:Fe-S oxidoreductase
MWERRRTIEGLPSILWSIYWNNNPWTQPPSTRRDWDPKSDVPLFDSSTHEILLYVGCTSSYDHRAQHIATALVSILQAANVPFGVLGEEEPCCGESVLSLGHRKYFKDLAQSATQIFQGHGVKKLVTISPHCYDVFANHYPHINNQFVPQHYTHFLASLIDENRLVFDHPVHKTITFQDPCFLARHNQTTEQPRLILKNIPGVKLIEMEDHALETLCCGGGGGRMWMETPPGERFSDMRVNQALDVGAEVIATACPFCLACLEDSVKAMQIPSLVVLDIAEIAALAILD